MYAASWVAMYRVPSPDSAAGDMTFFMICVMLSMVPLFGRNIVCVLKDKMASGLATCLWFVEVSSVAMCG